MTAKLDLSYIVARVEKKIFGELRHLSAEEEVEFFKQDENASNCQALFDLVEGNHNVDLHEAILNEDGSLNEDGIQFSELINGTFEGSYKDISESLRSVKLRDYNDVEHSLISEMVGHTEGSFSIPIIEVGSEDIDGVRQPIHFGGVVKLPKADSKTEFVNINNVFTKRVSNHATGTGKQLEIRKEFIGFRKTVNREKHECYQKNPEALLALAESRLDYMKDMHDDNSHARSLSERDNPFSGQDIKKKSRVFSGSRQKKSWNEGSASAMVEPWSPSTSTSPSFLELLESISNLEGNVSDKSTFTMRDVEKIKEAMFSQFDVGEDTEVTQSIRKWNIDYFYKSLFTLEPKRESLSFKNHSEVMVKIRQTLSIIQYLKNTFKDNIDVFDNYEVESLNNNLFNVGLDLNRELSDGYVLTVNNLDQNNGSLKFNTSFRSYRLMRNGELGLVDMRDSFSDDYWKTMIAVSNSYTKKYEGILSFLNNNELLVNKYLSEFGLDEPEQIVEKAEGDKEKRLEKLSNLLLQISGNSGLEGSEVQSKIEVVRQRLESSILRDITTEHDYLPGSASEVISKIIARQKENEINVNNDDDRNGFILNQDKLPTVMPVFNNSDILPTGNLLVEDNNSYEQPLEGLSSKNPMSSIVGEENVNRTPDEVVLYTASELVSRELSELKTLRNEIFEKEVKSLLAEVKEKIIEDPNFEISDDSDLAKTLRLIREIDRLTGMSANRLEGSPASLSTPNSSDRSRVELSGTNIKKGLIKSTTQTSIIFEEVDRGDLGLITEPKISLLDKKTEEALRKRKDVSDKDIEEIRKKLDKFYDGRLDYDGVLDDAVDGLTGGQRQKTVVMAQVEDGKDPETGEKRPRYAGIIATDRVPVEAKITVFKSERGTRAPTTVKLVPNYYSRKISITDKNLSGENGISKEDLLSRYSVDVDREVLVQRSDVKSLPESNSINGIQGKTIMSKLIEAECYRYILEQRTPLADLGVKPADKEQLSESFSAMVSGNEIMVGSNVKADSGIKKTKDLTIKDNPLMEDFFLNDGENAVIMREIQVLATAYEILVTSKTGASMSATDEHHNINQVIETSMETTNRLDNISDVPEGYGGVFHKNEDKFSQLIKLGKDREQLPDNATHLQIPVDSNGIIAINSVNSESVIGLNQAGEKVEEFYDQMEDGYDGKHGVQLRRVVNVEDLEGGAHTTESATQLNEEMRILAKTTEDYFNDPEQNNKPENISSVYIEPISSSEGSKVIEHEIHNINEYGEIQEKGGKYKGISGNNLDGLYDDLSKEVEEKVEGTEIYQVEIEVDGVKTTKYTLIDPEDGSLSIGSVRFGENKRNEEGKVVFEQVSIKQETKIRSNESHNPTYQKSKMTQIKYQDGDEIKTTYKSVNRNGYIPPGWVSSYDKVIADTIVVCREETTDNTIGRPKTQYYDPRR